MDISHPKFCQSPSLFAPVEEQEQGELQTSMYCKSKGNPFEEPLTVTDPMRKPLNLKDTFTNKKLESTAPATPGRPVFSFSVSRKSNFPSKWDDAEKWLISTTGSCHDSPAHHNLKSSKQFDGLKQNHGKVYLEKSRVSVEKGLNLKGGCAHHGFNDLDHNEQALAFNGSNHNNPIPALADVLLKDKFTNEDETLSPNFGCSEPTKEGFWFRNQSECEPMKDAGTNVAHNIKHRDIGTEMTPLGSSTTSRCNTPIKSTSPVRHNTPENRSGPLTLVTSNAIDSVDITQLQERHLAKLHIGSMIFDSITSNWSSREEEEEESSKSLRHSEVNNGARKSVCEARPCVWEDEEKTKHCLRYQREEAKIQAWVNLQHAKAEAQSKKLEVKIQKMRSDLEEKQMKRMASILRKAEEWRAEAQFEHSEQIRKATERALKMMARSSSKSSTHSSCGCFPCNNNIHH
ncbi:hypothetical protein Drorol1_Dr00013383 [Drosera rotundifolia]